MWLQPGGHLDRGESALEAAKRETLEETGITAKFDPNIFHVDVHETPSGHVHYDIRYLANTDDLIPKPGFGESQLVKWFSDKDLDSISDPALKGAIDKLRSNGKFLEH